jgi:hypothetical protein
MQKGIEKTAAGGPPGNTKTLRLDSIRSKCKYTKVEGQADVGKDSAKRITPGKTRIPSVKCMTNDRQFSVLPEWDWSFNRPDDRRRDDILKCKVRTLTLSNDRREAKSCNLEGFRENGSAFLFGWGGLCI